ncbi:MAG: GNAT family N-acetyltransferase [Anaerolineae bacterium]|nr:GNAT family N-acetyltransferase [Anaerolineae bacterium]
MSTAALTTKEGARRQGPRPLNLRTDLSGVADLVEVCFRDELDAGGRAVIQEMRALSRFAPLVWLLYGLNKMVKGLASGFVWIEDRRLVGNVSLYRTEANRAGWIIANVAVHPDYRRRGIARRLMHLSLDALAGYGARWGDLQVRHDNAPAQALYRSLGFVERGTWTTWRRPSHAAAPPFACDGPGVDIREAHGGDWRAIDRLAQLTRPYGLGWLRPLRPGTLRAGVGDQLRALLGIPNRVQYWAPGPDGAAMGALLVRLPGGKRLTHLTLLVHPAQRGQVEMPLLVYALCRLREWGVRRPVVIEHPHEDQAAAAALERLGFESRETLTQMRYSFVSSTGESSLHDGTAEAG